MGFWGRKDSQQGDSWKTRAGKVVLADWVAPHLHVDKPGRITEERDRQ